MLKRFSVSLDEELLKEFDHIITREGYTNRSEALRDLIRNDIVQKEWLEGDRETAGVVILVYDHRKLELPRTLTHSQHHHHDAIISTLHIHLDNNNCMEVIVLKGKAKEIQHIAHTLISTKGVKHGKFINTTTGKDLI
jgi:CopG family transcriptional regulator, nickel-responsive regulator